MPLIEDRSRPSSMAAASRCTTAPTAAVPAIGDTGRSGPPRDPEMVQSKASIQCRPAPGYGGVGGVNFGILNASGQAPFLANFRSK